VHAAAEIDVKAIRRKTGLSQQEFAYSYGFTMEQIRSWEQKRATPLGGVRVYLMMIDTDTEGVGRILEAARNRHAARSLPSLRPPTTGKPRNVSCDRRLAACSPTSSEAGRLSVDRRNNAVFAILHSLAVVIGTRAILSAKLNGVPTH
jgi:putative transcriptional regulator